MENLLGGYRAAGHSFHGIIAATFLQYAHLGDASTMTDNRIYAPDLAPGERRETPEGSFSGTRDDRWAFTNHDTALEYRVAAALAAASRVLRQHRPELAEERANAARIWQAEHSAPRRDRGAYVPRGARCRICWRRWSCLLAAGDDRAAAAPIATACWRWTPTLEPRALRIAGALARAVPALAQDPTGELASALRALIEAHQPELARSIQSNLRRSFFSAHQGHRLQLLTLPWNPTNSVARSPTWWTARASCAS